MPERLQGLLLILAGCVSLGLVSLSLRGASLLPAPPLAPPGQPPELSALLTPLPVVLALIAVGGLGLCLVGLRKLLAPDDWQPPRHLG
jgi:hypothetical protein